MCAIGTEARPGDAGPDNRCGPVPPVATWGERRNYLLYDGECPACRSYLAISRLRELRPDLAVLDARREPALVAELRGRGYEINEGMVLALDGRIFFGAEVTRMVALFGEAQPPPRRLLLFAIGAAPWSRRLYPWLNRGRQLLLRILGRGLIG